jgi:hypothetical protein
MRLAVVTLGALVAAVVAGAAQAHPQATANDSESAIVVVKDLARGPAQVEVRERRTGRIIRREAAVGERWDRKAACIDPRFRLIRARWRSTPGLFVNVASLEGIPGSASSFLSSGEVLADVLGGMRAWSNPFVTDCRGLPIRSGFSTSLSGPTTRTASLADGVTEDGVNVVEFRSLEGTVCDGAVACTLISYDRGRIFEADMLFEKSLKRLSGLEDYWTTGDTTAIEPSSAQFAVVDTATHEFGHFAGLDHVNRSPDLTMFPFIHDGMQTLGLGDMAGIRALY